MTNETRAILRTATEIVKTRWYQGSLVGYIAGEPCYCTLGAIMKASEAYPAAHGMNAEALVEYAVRAKGFNSIGTWNDRPERRQAEVIALLESVANQNH